MNEQRDMGNRTQVYVSVTAIHYVNGLCSPQVIEAAGGAVMIHDVRKVQKLTGKDYCGAEERYLVKTGSEEMYLYRKGQRWFIFAQKGKPNIFGIAGS